MTTVISVRGKDPAVLRVDPRFVYVADACYLWPASFWDNPFKVGMTRIDAFDILIKHDMIVVHIKDAFRPLNYQETIDYHEGYMHYDLYRKSRIHELRNKILGCWCGDWQPGQPEIACHAVVLAKLADSLP